MDERTYGHVFTLTQFKAPCIRNDATHSGWVFSLQLMEARQLPTDRLSDQPDVDNPSLSLFLGDARCVCLTIKANPQLGLGTQT